MRQREHLRLKGKPSPDTFLEAAYRLGVYPRKAVVIEDALAGVTAGRAGAFGLIIAIDRVGQGKALQEAGASVVVSDLSTIVVNTKSTLRTKDGC